MRQVSKIDRAEGNIAIGIPEYIPDVADYIYKILAELPDEEATPAIVEVAIARLEPPALQRVADQLMGFVNARRASRRNHAISSGDCSRRRREK